MRRLIPVVTSIFLSGTIVPYIAQAADTSSSTTNTSPSTTSPSTTSPSTTSPSTTSPSTTNPSTTNSNTTNNSSSLSKDDWFKSITPLLPELICKGFENDAQLKKRLDDIKMTHEKCMTVIPESVSKCQQQLYSSIPDNLNDESAATWGKTLGECIGKDFAIKYLIPKSQ